MTQQISSSPHVNPAPAELIVALDVSSVDEIDYMAARIGDSVNWYKVGLELYCAVGDAAFRPLARREKRVFLDLKLHDIPRTVERAIKSLSRNRMDMITVHASGGPEMLKSAATAAAEAGDRAPLVLAVTVLTSLGQADLSSIGIEHAASDQVLRLVEVALKAGVRGIVCSPREISAIRARFGSDPILVTPGIRPAGGELGDQKRVATPESAVRDGANYLVVGRPILEANDPSAAAKAILREMSAAKR